MDHVLINVRVTPRASANKVVPSTGPDGMPVLNVHVTAVPADGDANAAVVRVLSEHFGIAKSSIVIVRGLAGRNKLVRIPARTALGDSPNLG